MARLLGRKLTYSLGMLLVRISFRYFILLRFTKYIYYFHNLVGVLKSAIMNIVMMKCLVHFRLSPNLVAAEK